MNTYEMSQEMTGENRKLQGNLTEKVFQNREGPNKTICLNFLEGKNQVIECSKEDECVIHSKEKELK